MSLLAGHMGGLRRLAVRSAQAATSDRLSGAAPLNRTMTGHLDTMTGLLEELDRPGHGAENAQGKLNIGQSPMRLAIDDHTLLSSSMG